MLDLELVPVRSAPGNLVSQPNNLEIVPVRSAPEKLVSQAAPTTRSEAEAVEVLEPEDSTPRLALPAPSSSGAYRIPRLPAPVSAPIKRTVRRLSAKKAAVLADRIAKRERKANRKVCPRARRFCKTCKVSSTSAKAFYDHVNSRKHRIRAKNAKSTPHCVPCGRQFESHGHLKTRRNGAAHLKVVYEQNNTNASVSL